MPKCKFKGCTKTTRYKNTVEQYCPMHKERIKRHGYPELKKDAYQILEKLPHKAIDHFILKNCQSMFDIEITKELHKMGYKNATVWNVGYRRRKLGNRKYLRGEIQKHKVWIRTQAIKKYGNKCELCNFNLVVDTHHIVPKYQGGLHEINNLMIVCPNCHALITRGYLKLNRREDIPKIRTKVTKSLKEFYSDLW